MKYKPYIAKVAYWVVEREDFAEIGSFINEQTSEYTYRECDEGEVYLEFEPQVLDNKNVPNIGNVEKLGVDIIQIWLD